MLFVSYFLIWKVIPPTLVCSCQVAMWKKHERCKKDLCLYFITESLKTTCECPEKITAANYFIIE